VIFREDTTHNWGPGDTDPDHRYIAIGRDEIRDVRAKGLYHTSTMVPSSGLAGHSKPFRPLVVLFTPLFFLLGPLISPLPETNLCFYLFDFEAQWNFILTSLAPFSFLAFIFIIIIVVIRISIFTTDRRFFVSVQRIIIIINSKEACMLLRTLRFIRVYLFVPD